MNWAEEVHFRGRVWVDGTEELRLGCACVDGAQELALGVWVWMVHSKSELESIGLTWG